MQKISVAIGMNVILVGCGTSTGGGGTTGGGGGGAASGAPVPIDNLETAVKKAFCESATACPGSDLLFCSNAACEAFLNSSDNFEFGRNVEKIKAGKIKYDAAQAGLCLKEMVVSCSMSSGKEPAACKAAMIGLVKSGEACSIDEECEPTTFCKQKASDCPGVCTKEPALGEDCPDGRCASGAQCDSSGAAQKCVADKPAGDGEACGSVDCAEGLTCDFSQSSPVCKKKGAAGETCNGSDACADGLFCGKDGKCLVKAKLNEACAAPGDRRSCVDGHVCGVIGKISDGKLKCIAIKKLGEACISHQACAAVDLLCKGLDVTAASPTGTCGFVPKLGEACTPSGDTYPQFPACMIGNSCDSATMKCVGPGAKGDVCGVDTDRQCGKGLTCDTDNEGKGTCKEEPKAQCN